MGFRARKSLKESYREVEGVSCWESVRRVMLGVSVKTELGCFESVCQTSDNVVHGSVMWRCKMSVTGEWVLLSNFFFFLTINIYMARVSWMPHSRTWVRHLGVVLLRVDAFSCLYPM